MLSFIKKGRISNELALVTNNHHFDWCWSICAVKESASHAQHISYCLQRMTSFAYFATQVPCFATQSEAHSHNSRQVTKRDIFPGKVYLSKSSHLFSQESQLFLALCISSFCTSFQRVQLEILWLDVPSSGSWISLHSVKFVVLNKPIFNHGRIASSRVSQRLTSKMFFTTESLDDQTTTYHSQTPVNTNKQSAQGMIAAWNIIYQRSTISEDVQHLQDIAVHICCKISRDFPTCSSNYTILSGSIFGCRKL